MRAIGQQVSKEEVYNRDNWTRRRVVDFGKKRFIQTGELYTPEGPTTLDWENLGDLNKRSGVNGSVLFPKIGDFEDLLTFLIDPLEEKGEFYQRGREEGFYCFLDNYCSGIHAYGERGTGPWGNAPEERIYYPKRLEDAEGYLKYIVNGGIPALMGKRVFSEK